MQGNLLFESATRLIFRLGLAFCALAQAPGETRPYLGARRIACPQLFTTPPLAAQVGAPADPMRTVGGGLEVVPLMLEARR